MLWAPTMAERAKPCSKRGKEKPLSEYYRRPTGPDGRQAEKSFVLLSRHSNDRPLLKPHSLRSLHAGSVARIYPSLRIASSQGWPRLIPPQRSARQHRGTNENSTQNSRRSKFSPASGLGQIVSWTLFDTSARATLCVQPARLGFRPRPP